MNSQFHYLTADDVIRLHEATIKAWGNTPGGLHNRAALESSVAQPKMEIFGVERHPTLYAKAAAYCYFLIRNHPFIDGNKRIGVAAATLFAKLNGVEPAFGDYLEETALGIAAGRVSLDDSIEFIRRALTR